MANRFPPGPILAALTLVLPACGRGATPRTAAPDSTTRPNVLLVTIDTVRADRLGCYGHAGAATPVLDGLAARGVRFATAIAHVPLTGPSHASILTGLGPLGHGFRENAGFALPAEVDTGAVVFGRAGYRRAAFVSAFPLDRRFGFDRGFTVFDDHLPKGNDPRRTPYVERFADATTDAALRWLGTPPAEGEAALPFFLWVHYYDPHAPYEPPGDLAERFGSSPYDGEIAFVDRQLGRLLRTLDEEGRLSRTVVLVVGDHGEGLGEHGEGTHGLFIYDSTLRVPLIVAGPGVPAGRVSSTVARGMDVLPTLLDLAGVPTPAAVEGRSLRPALEGHDLDDVPAYVESIYGEREFGWAPLFGWRTATRKFIEAPRPELYDLESDPAESSNIAAQEQDRVARMRGSLQAAMERTIPDAATAVDPETAARLAALGYVGTSGGGGRHPAGSERDPKDGIRLMPRLNRGMSAVRSDPPLAIRELRAVLAEDPGLLMARRSLAVAYAAAGRHDEAVAELRGLEKQGHLSAEDAVVLGDNLRFAGQLDEAQAVLERTARENPRFAQPWLSIAEIQVRRRDLAAAAAAYDEVLQLAPDHIEALRGQGDLALMQEKTDDAGRRYARILEIDPGDPGALTKLGVVRMRERRPGEAIALFRRAVGREPANAEALLYLAGALASTGNPAEALPFFERARAADPRSTMTLNGLALTRLALGDREGAARAFRESLGIDADQPDIARALADLTRGPGG